MEVDELFDAWERAWSGRDPRGFESLCADGFHYEDPLTPSRSRAARAGRHARQLWAAFPDARVNATGARLRTATFACAPCQLLGTHTGPLGGISRTGRAVIVHAVVYAELEDGRLLRVRAFYDVYDAGDAARRAAQAGHARASGRC